MIGRSTLKQLLGRINAACQTVCKQLAGSEQENTVPEANETKSDLCVSLVRLTPKKYANFAMNFPMLFIENDKKYISGKNYLFSDFMNGKTFLVYSSLFTRLVRVVLSIVWFCILLLNYVY